MKKMLFIVGSASALTPCLLLPTEVRAQVAQQSYLRNTPSEIEREDPRVSAVIARAEEHFKLDELNLRDGHFAAARAEFDKAVDTVLESGVDVRSDPRLQTYYKELLDRVYRLERPLKADAAQDTTPPVTAPQEPQRAGFVEQKFEPSPLDELSKIELTSGSRPRA